LDFSAEEARKLKFNPNFAEFGCGSKYIIGHDTESENYIPRLEEVLMDLKGSQMIVKIELKGPETTVPVLEMVEKLNMVDQCHFSSFDHEKLRLIRQLRPQMCEDGVTYRYKTGALFRDDIPENFIKNCLNFGASEIHLKYDTCTKERISAIHDAGMRSMAWFRGPIGMLEDVTLKYDDVGNEDEIMYEMIMASGVQSLCCNRPDVLFRVIDSPR